MFSYRHGFHAGNFADLLKHQLQVEIIAHLQNKDKPFDYIDTHAGAGIYRLDIGMAAKNCEYQSGIGHFLPASACKHAIPEIQTYLDLVAALNPDDELQFYPGSPAIAASLLRPQDKGWLFELHPADSQLLQENFAGNRQFKVRKEDGFAGLAALLPTQSRRAFILIDPPYELKEDYQRVVETLKLINRKMATATVALWYPVVERPRIDALEKQILVSGIRNVAQFELGVSPDSSGHGMTSSGMIVINPPWTLQKSMDELLPRLAKIVSHDGNPVFRSGVLVAE